MALLQVWFTASVFFMVASGQCFPKAMERGPGHNLHCPLPPSNVKSITWQLSRNGSFDVDISHCSMVDFKCTDLMSSLYTAYVFADEGTTGLNVLNPRYNESRFSYLRDDGVRSSIADIEIYQSPSFVPCEPKYTNSYVDFFCPVDNVYPGIQGSLERLERPLLQSDFDQNETNCTLGAPGSGNLGDYSAVCNWRIKMESMLPINTFTAKLAANVTNNAGRNVTHTETVTFIAPVAELFVCPVPPATVNIARGGSCICRIKAINGRQPKSPGFARWYTQDHQIVGAENPSDMSSTLTLTYNAADKNPKYYCKPVTELNVSVVPLNYAPKFSTSSPRIVATTLQPLIILAGVILSGITRQM